MADPVEIEITLKQVIFDQFSQALDFFVHAGNAGLHRALLPNGGDLPGQIKQTPVTYQVAVVGSQSEIRKLMETWHDCSNPKY